MKHFLTFLLILGLSLFFVDSVFKPPIPSIIPSPGMPWMGPPSVFSPVPEPILSGAQWTGIVLTFVGAGERVFRLIAWLIRKKG